MLELWGMRSTPSLLSFPGPFWPELVTTDRFLSMGQKELNCVLMLSWITWNRTVLKFNCALTKKNTYTKLNWLKYNCLTKRNSLKWKYFWQLDCVLMLNWIVWNRTVHLYKMDLALNNLQRLICHKTQTNEQTAQQTRVSCVL